MQQKLPNLTVGELKETNAFVKGIRELSPSVLFIVHLVKSDIVTVANFSEASFNVS